MRIDNYLFEEQKFSSRTKAKEAVERGEVLVNGHTVKPSYSVGESDVITFCDTVGKYVSNGAFKLEKAFSVFDLNVEGKVFADVGASTGGFTQCLLLNNIKRVYALDVGESLLNPLIAADDRVVVIENTNARFMTTETFGERLDGIVTDVSFISLTYILPAIFDVLNDNGVAVLLIKPQFECGPKHLSKNGIVTDKKIRYDCCRKIIDFAIGLGFGVVGFDVAPLRAGKNAEFLLYVAKNKQTTINDVHVLNICKQ